MKKLAIAALAALLTTPAAIAQQGVMPQPSAPQAPPQAQPQPQAQPPRQAQPQRQLPPGVNPGRVERPRDFRPDRPRYGRPPYAAPRYARPPAYHRDWRRGERFPDWRNRTVIYNYGRYGLRRPGPGQRWVRVDDRYVLVSIATGVILSIITR